MTVATKTANRHQYRQVTGGATWKALRGCVSPYHGFQGDRLRQRICKESRKMSDLLAPEADADREFYFIVGEATYHLLRIGEYSGYSLHLVGQTDAALTLNIYPGMFNIDPGERFMAEFLKSLESYFEGTGFDIKMHAQRPANGIFECQHWAESIRMKEVINKAIVESIAFYKGAEPLECDLN